MRGARRILVAVDRLDGFEAVVNAVAAVAAEDGSEVRVLHVQEYARSGPARFDLEEASDANFVCQLAALELSLAGVAATPHLLRALYENTARAISAAACSFGADLIVLGAARRRRLPRLRQRVTERVSETAPCPVLVVGRDATERSIAIRSHALRHPGSS